LQRWAFRAIDQFARVEPVLGLMQRALDEIAQHETIGKARMRMGAQISHRKHPAVTATQRDFDSLRSHRARLSRTE
jgi:hypothetical protein